VGSEQNVQILQSRLQQRGVYGSVFCYPATGRNRALIRLTVHSQLSELDVARVVEAFKAAGEELRAMGVDGFFRPCA
jgi:CAI-1 autoinducer synthase